jgi:hypothetical protein
MGVSKSEVGERRDATHEGVERSVTVMQPRSRRFLPLAVGAGALAGAAAMTAVAVLAVRSRRPATWRGRAADRFPTSTAQRLATRFAEAAGTVAGSVVVARLIRRR